MFKIIVTFSKKFLQVRIACYDKANPDQKVVTDLIFPIKRNEYGPQFQKVSNNMYSKEISENFELGKSILQVTASDRDQVKIFGIIQFICFIVLHFFNILFP